MQIDLSKEMAMHFKRLNDLAEEAAKDKEESYSSRASAMSALTAVIKELTKTQAEIVNMAAIQELQSAIVEALEDHDPEFKKEVIVILERRLETLT